MAVEAATVAAEAATTSIVEVVVAEVAMAVVVAAVWTEAAVTAAAGVATAEIAVVIPAVVATPAVAATLAAVTPVEVRPPEAVIITIGAVVAVATTAAVPLVSITPQSEKLVSPAVVLVNLDLDQRKRRVPVSVGNLSVHLLRPALDPEARIKDDQKMIEEDANLLRVMK